MLSSIPTAEEARKRLDEMKKEEGNRVYKEVAEAINTAIDNLQDCCSIHGELPKDLVEELVKKKYRIRVRREYTNPKTYIFW